jgi:UDP-GlcNAc:undecaprenyl-phosphate GlcNAc-1-phosphate transferase
MFSLLTLSIAACLLALVLTPVCRDVFAHYGLVDRPDQERKTHTRSVPRVGGLAVLAAFVGAFCILLLLPLTAGSVVAQKLGVVSRLAPGVLLVFLTGLVDDLKGLSPWQKLAGQLAGAAWACAMGVRIGALGSHRVEDWFWSVPLTLLWLLVCTNAFNLIDGLDGLATGVGLFATVTTFVAALFQGNLELAMATAPLAGALVGFLRYNFSPASIFLGDSGSLTIGFLLGCYGVLWTQKSTTLLGMTAPVMALSLPILDVSLAILRRFLRRKPIFAADRGHIHHRLVDRGLTPRRTVMLLYGCCSLAAICSLLQSVANNGLAALVILLFCGAAWLAVQKLGYPEFRAAGQLLAHDGLREQINDRLALTTAARALAGAPDLDTCWPIVCETCHQFGFYRVTLHAGRIQYRDRGREAGASGWIVRVPLSPNGDYLQLGRTFDRQAPAALGPLLDTLRTALEPKLDSRPRPTPAPVGPFPTRVRVRISEPAVD